MYCGAVERSPKCNKDISFLNVLSKQGLLEKLQLSEKPVKQTSALGMIQFMVYIYVLRNCWNVFSL